MTNTIGVPTIAEEDPDQDLTYAQAALDVSAAQRRAFVVQVVELRERMERAKESHRKAQERFEKTVYLLASGQPTRIDWYEYPGAIPRKDLIKAGKLTTQSLHRIMLKQQGRKKKVKR